jgi:cobalt-zinc-cadmium efflux system outer membrane protein
MSPLVFLRAGVARQGAAALASLCIAVACESPPEGARHPSVEGGVEPPAWLEGEGSEIDPRTAGPMSLRRLLAYADAHAPSLQVEAQQAAVADAEVEGADTLVPHNPELSVSAGGRTEQGTTRFAFGAELEQRLEIAGERGTRVEAAERARAAAYARLDVLRWEVHAEVQGLFYRALTQRAQIEAAEQLVSFAEAVHVILQKRVDAGEESPLGAIVARTEIAQARQAALSARAGLRASEIRLAALIGWPVETPLRLRGKLAPPRRAPSVASLTERALSRHPSRRWLELEVSAAEARVEREDRAAWPDPSLAVSYEYEPEAMGETHVWLGTLSVPLPIWERNQAARARARAEAAVARAERASFEVRLRARIAAAVERVNVAANVAELYSADILPAFKTNLDKLGRAFELGEIDALELSQIRGRILATQNDALTALADYYGALAELEALVGSELPKRNKRAP